MEHLEFCERLTASWVRRTEAQSLKPTTVRYKTAQLDFFLGACAAMTVLKTNPLLLLLIVAMSLSAGRDSRNVWPGYTKYMKADEEPAQKDPEPLDPKSG